MTHTKEQIKAAVNSVADILTQIEVLNEAKKDILAELKDKDYPVKTIAKTAALLVRQKHQDYREEATEILDFIDICA